MKGNTLFTPLERETILHQLIASLKTDPRIVGVVLVGSGAIGFTDRFSDIDLVAVVDPKSSTQIFFQEWVQRLQKELSIIHWFEVSFDGASFLAGFLLSGCLEIDFGVVNANELIARKGRWKIVYDHSGQIEARLQTSWRTREKEELQVVAKRFTSIWHYIIQTVVSVQRKQLWRAIHNLEEVRNRGLRLAGHRHGLIVSHFREIDRLPEGVRKEFEHTIVHSVDTGEIMRALQAAVGCFFQEMRAIEQKGDDFVNTAKLKSEMIRLLEEYDS